MRKISSVQYGFRRVHQCIYYSARMVLPSNAYDKFFQCPFRAVHEKLVSQGRDNVCTTQPVHSRIAAIPCRNLAE
jgi:hypothetical protein